MASNLRAHIFVFGYLILLSIVMLGQSFSMSSIPDIQEFSSTDIWMMKIGQVLSVLILFILPAVIYAVFFTQDKIKTLGIHRFGEPVYYLLGGLCFLTAIPFINYLGEWNASLHFPSFLSGLEASFRLAEETVEKMMLLFLDMKTPLDLIINLGVIALAAAVSEELFFRGVLQNHLVKTTHRLHLSVWITALLFSALHGQFFGFIPRMLLGGILGYFYVFSGSLWVPILGHFINNGFQVVWIYFYLKTHPIEELKESSMSSGDTLPLVAISLVLSTLFAWLAFRRKQKS